jgi:diaminohydroxyphosphoribosylaminopyrimidine deaminase/5-amino-6-(5-phosphoribosylamino)uracil reductase
VVGCLDPNPEVDGRGVAMLRAAGVRVDGPVLEAEAKQLIAPFIARTRLGRPYVTLKWAQTADGKVAGPGGARMQISNERSIRLMHELRARSDAILVGIRTVMKDDPMLTARGVEGARPLTRIVLDPTLAIPHESRLVRTAREHPLVVLGSCEVFHQEPSRVQALERLGVRVEPVNTPNRHFPLEKVLEEIGRAGVTHLMVEPGPSLARSFFHLADRIWVFRSPKVSNDPHAPGAVEFDLPIAGQMDLDGDTLTEYLNPKSPVFFGNTPSPDLVLARS